MDAKSIVQSLVSDEELEVIAPVTGNENWIIFRHCGRTYKFRAEALPIGWHKIKFFTSNSSFQRIDYANPTDVMTYLIQFKPIRMIVIRKLKGQMWMCYPYNLGDAAQKGISQTTQVVHLVEGEYLPFDCLQASIVGNELIYRCSDLFVKLASTLTEYLPNRVDWEHPNFTSATPETKNVYETLAIHLGEELKRSKEIMKKLREGTTEEFIRSQLEFLGAELQSWNEVSGQVKIVWRDGGYTHNSVIERDMKVTHAGICLSDKDRDFNLASLVDVMREARTLNRPGAHGGNDGQYEDY